MDEYTADTKAWLERRYRQTSPRGVYQAHQPIYGFRAGNCEPYLFERYVRTIEMLRALAQLRFSTCVDIGAAEGYKADLVRRVFGASVVASDLSEEACKRAEEIYGLRTQVADVQALPFADGEFDVALCSETLEHVPDLAAGVREVLRVASKAAIITVPHEPLEVVEHNREAGREHDHIQALDVHSLDWVRDELGYDVTVQPIVHPLTVGLSSLVEGARHALLEPQAAHRASNLVRRALNALAGSTSRVLGVGSEAALVPADRAACRVSSTHRALVFVVVKDPAAFSSQPLRRVRPREILDVAVPLHLLPGRD
jgi:SAM-dependent methyltransferase